MCFLFVLIFIFIICLFPKIDLFLFSFMPLFIILIIKASIEQQKLLKNILCINLKNIFSINLKNLFWFAIIILTIIPVIVFIGKLICIVCFADNKNMTTSITEVSNVDDSIVSYIMTYIIPLTSLTYDSSISEYITNLLLFIVIMIIYVRMDLLYLNPIFILFGLNVYRIKTNNKLNFILTNATYAQLNSKKEEKVKLHKISNTLFFKWFKKNEILDVEN